MGGGGKASPSFCEQKEAKKLHPLPGGTAVTPWGTGVDAGEQLKFFWFFLFTKRTPSLP
jgi:hypothetical protein